MGDQSPSGRPVARRPSTFGPDPLTLPTTDWLRHDLVVTGPAAEVARFAAAARGAGVIPWTLVDRRREEEDRVHALLHPPDGSPGLSLMGARTLARLLRSACERHDEAVIVAAGRRRDCSFDLHALLPVPGHILQHGPDEPASTDWLRSQWGVIRSLRHVRDRTEKADGRLRRSARLRFEFWSADWTPWVAFRDLRAQWARLSFELKPDYGGE